MEDSDYESLARLDNPAVVDSAIRNVYLNPNFSGGICGEGCAYVGSAFDRSAECWDGRRTLTLYLIIKSVQITCLRLTEILLSAFLERAFSSGENRE